MFSRNSKCWCGSGKKFKHCHLGRSERKRPTFGEIYNVQEKAFSRQVCLHPFASQETCDSKIIKAHALQKNGALSRIADRRMVYGVKSTLANVRDNRGIPKFEKLNIASASTFSGFCGKHDKDLFSNVEDQPLKIERWDQAFLLGYRAICRELHFKSIEKQSVLGLKDLDAGRSFGEQFYLNAAHHAQMQSVDQALSDALASKANFDACFISNSFLNFRFFAIEFDKVPEVVCTGSTYPDIDLLDRPLQDLYQKDVTHQMLTFSLVPKTNSGIALFTWFEMGDNSPKLFIDSLKSIPVAGWAHAVIRYSFNSFENLYFNPAWWDAMSSTNQALLVRRMASGTNLFGDNSVPLRDDGQRVVNWSVINVFDNSTENKKVVWPNGMGSVVRPHAE